MNQRRYVKFLTAGAIILASTFVGCSSGNAAASSPDNPLIGNWTLADTDKNYCATHEEFRKDSVIEVKSGKKASYTAIYLIKPNYVDVAMNGDMLHYQEWDETAPDEVTFRINSLYVAASCRYHRG